MAGFLENVRGLMDYSERSMRAEIGQIPDGRYRFEDVMEDDGIIDQPYTIRAEVTVKGSDPILDHHGSSPQAKGPINGTLGVTHGAAYNAILQLTDSTVPKNSGCFRFIRVLAPPGTVVNVNFPGPSVGGNIEAHCRIADVVMGALASGLKDRSAATDGASHSNFLFGGIDAETGEFFCCYDLSPVGWGGRSFADGNDAVGGINGNCPHIPVEVFEYRFAWHVEEFRLVDGSGGPGTFRGGPALSKTVRCTDTPMTFSYMGDHQKVSPWGIHGGHPGAKAELFMQRAGDDEWLTITQAFNKVSPSKFCNVPVAPGDRIRISSPAGGGWGPPEARDPQRVEDDLLDGFITPEQARSVYGVTD